MSNLSTGFFKVIQLGFFTSDKQPVYCFGHYSMGRLEMKKKVDVPARLARAWPDHPSKVKLARGSLFLSDRDN